MAGEDQGKFEDYLELERYIEEIQAGRPARPPQNLTPEQVRIYRMVALFRAATPAAAEPRPEFASSLREHLLALNAEEPDEKTHQLPHVQKADLTGQSLAAQEEQSVPQPQVAEVPTVPTERSGERKRALFFSRRNLMRGGAVAAVTLAAGAGGVAIGVASERAAASKNSATPIASATPATSSVTNYPASIALDANVSTTWQPVTTLEALGAGAVRFVTSTLIGYVIRNDGDDKYADPNGIIAMSAACTHRGCIVQWQDTDRQFHCPCHGGVFTEYGTPSTTAGSLRYLDPLPRLETKIEHGQVYVKVPATTQV
ncbi:MAG TPA: Rieske (2Fe-2S) protein [Ktedonobacteraceae bacterium]|nr:Rieske (2Fe-2S) protein [Ktedonobacteraceae bacterium]